MNINWYPGHMKKTAEIIKSHLGLVDVVIELLDARIPISSSNPTISNLLKDKKRVIGFTKSDLADAKITKEWIEYFDFPVVELSKNSNTSHLEEEILKVTSDLADKLKGRGRLLRPVRAMVLGIPNVGKSTIINRLTGKNVAKTGNKAGVTRGKQWIRIKENLELFDTPGILWPKFDEKTGLLLAATGAINDAILTHDELAFSLLPYLSPYQKTIEEKYSFSNLSFTDREDRIKIIQHIGAKRTALMKKGEVDLEKAAKVLIDDFRNGQLGRITLERPNA